MTVDVGAEGAVDPGKPDLLQSLGTSIDLALRTPHAFVDIDEEKINRQGRLAAYRKDWGLTLGPVDGLTVSIKDLFDVRGEPTRAGSRIFDPVAPAADDSVAVARLRRAGAILFGRTNMPELAFSGLGLNPALGTPANPRDPERIPGGSTSGGAVSVAHGIVDVALGTDTSGSVRIPAAFCGLVGVKPSPGLIPTDGVVPLAPSLDTVGVIGRDMQTCADMLQILAGREPARIPPASLAGTRVLAVTDPAADRDTRTATAFRNALGVLEDAGVFIDQGGFAAADLLAPVMAQGGFVAPEAFSVYAGRLETGGERIDPLVLARFQAGGRWTARSWLDAVAVRNAAIASARFTFDRVDIVVAPTVATVAPRFDALAQEEDRLSHNRLVIRDTAVANMLGLCSVSLPMTGGGLPVGLMLLGGPGADDRTMALAKAIAPLIRAL